MQHTAWCEEFCTCFDVVFFIIELLQHEPFLNFAVKVSKSFTKKRFRGRRNMSWEEVDFSKITVVDLHPKIKHIIDVRLGEIMNRITKNIPFVRHQQILVLAVFEIKDFDHEIQFIIKWICEKNKHLADYLQEVNGGIYFIPK